MSPQAYVVTIVYFIILIIYLGAIIKARQFTVMQIISFFVSLGMILLIIYDTDCLTKGSCNVWSWIRTIIYVIFPTLVIILLGLSLFTVDEDKQPKQQSQIQQQQQIQYVTSE